MAEPAASGPDPSAGQVTQSVTCPGCGAVYDRRYLTECCRYEAGAGYRCPVCNHFLERENA